jgi:hypothetical protein
MAKRKDELSEELKVCLYGLVYGPIFVLAFTGLLIVPWHPFIKSLIVPLTAAHFMWWMKRPVTLEKFWW